jgi:hypothetical protein
MVFLGSAQVIPSSNVVPLHRVEVVNVRKAA